MVWAISRSAFLAGRNPGCGERVEFWNSPRKKKETLNIKNVEIREYIGKKFFKLYIYI